MSSLVVEVCKIETVRFHPNADKLELVIIKGWQCVVGKGSLKEGDLVVYVPIDSVIPPAIHEPMGISKYLSNGRVRCAKLRGEPSFGVILPVTDASWQEGQDVAEILGITKYQPPLRLSGGDAAPENSAFPKYTNIENLRNRPRAILDGEMVVATEKIHGTNCRIGVVDGVWMAGSRELRRKETTTPESNFYWYPTTLKSVQQMVAALVEKGAKSVVLYGEVYGSKVQSLNYGVSGGSLGFSAFDLMIDGKYVNYDDFLHHCHQHLVPTVPAIYIGPYSIEAIKSVASGQTLINTAVASHIREGVVVKPLVERTDPKLGRVILKYLSDDYLFSKNADVENADA